MAERILVVDDALSMVSLVEMTLTNEGYEVVTASNGAEALGKLNGTAFDLILTDLNMPAMNGVELIKAIKSKPEHSFTPIVMLTTESGADKKEAGKAAGAKAWIVKPFKTDKLIGVVKSIIG